MKEHDNGADKALLLSVAAPVRVAIICTTFLATTTTWASATQQNLRLRDAIKPLDTNDVLNFNAEQVLRDWAKYNEMHGYRDPHTTLPKITPLIAHVAMMCNLTGHDTLEILTAIKNATGDHGKTFLITITDGGMTDMVTNMLRSLTNVPGDPVPRLVVGIGANVCSKLKKFEDSSTHCIEVFKYATAEEASAWGTQSYYNVIVRKHAILTMASVSLEVVGMIYSDPDIVYLRSPIEYMEQEGQDNDITFSENNCLLVDAADKDDYPEVYIKKGMEHILRGPNKRRVDINTGLFYLKRGNIASKVMIKTMRILNNGANGHERAYQQYSLVEAIKEVEEVKIGVFQGDKFVNGNLYWGHRGLLNPDEVISVHANWMPSSIKKTCLQMAGFWYDDKDDKLQRLHMNFDGDVVRMDRLRGTIVYCGRETMDTFKEEDE